MAEGASVVLSDVLDAQGEEVAASIGAGARYLHLDVRSESDWAAAVAATVEEFGLLNVLINNAGIHVKMPMEEMTLDHYMDVVSTNQVGVWLGMGPPRRPYGRPGRLDRQHRLLGRAAGHAHTHRLLLVEGRCGADPCRRVELSQARSG